MGPSERTLTTNNTSAFPSHDLNDNSQQETVKFDTFEWSA